MFNHAPFYSKFSIFHKNSIMLFHDPRMCNLVQPISFSQCKNKKILIFGDSNVGKTHLTSQFLSYLRDTSSLKKIYVVEMGPERFQVDNYSVGGRLIDYDPSYQHDPSVLYYNYPITPPRSASKNDAEVYKNCLKNYKIIHDEFTTVIDTLVNSSNNDSALIINDFSIYMHLGSHIPFLKLLKSSHTVFVNAYFGQKLAEDYGSNISWRERVLVKLLIRRFDYAIHLMK
ncbi:MAG: hypothetical protein EU530_01975 [Promethearchaeota archaeon]|nr:MAG: hypothetical protein EU530_01975 [Candidatus Lokiarchaeota archaeon]